MNHRSGIFSQLLKWARQPYYWVTLGLIIGVATLSLLSAAYAYYDGLGQYEGYFTEVTNTGPASTPAADPGALFLSGAASGDNAFPNLGCSGGNQGCATTFINEIDSYLYDGNAQDRRGAAFIIGVALGNPPNDGYTNGVNWARDNETTFDDDVTKLDSQGNIEWNHAQNYACGFTNSLYTGASDDAFYTDNAHHNGTTGSICDSESSIIMNGLGGEIEIKKNCGNLVNTANSFQEQTVTISGKVTRSDGTALGGLTITFCSGDVSDPAHPDPTSTTTAGDGTWSASVPSGNQYCVKVSGASGNGWDWGSPSATYVSSACPPDAGGTDSTYYSVQHAHLTGGNPCESGNKGYDFTYSPTTTVSGRVTFTDGQPIAGVPIYLCYTGSEPTTDGNGYWSASGAPINKNGPSMCARIAGGPVNWESPTATQNWPAHAGGSYENQYPGMWINNGQDLNPDNEYNFTYQPWNNYATLDVGSTITAGDSASMTTWITNNGPGAAAPSNLEVSAVTNGQYVSNQSTGSDCSGGTWSSSTPACGGSHWEWGVGNIGSGVTDAESFTFTASPFTPNNTQICFEAWAGPPTDSSYWPGYGGSQGQSSVQCWTVYSWHLESSISGPNGSVIKAGSTVNYNVYYANTGQGHSPSGSDVQLAAVSGYNNPVNSSNIGGPTGGPYGGPDCSSSTPGGYPTSATRACTVNHWNWDFGNIPANTGSTYAGTATFTIPSNAIDDTTLCLEAWAGPPTTTSYYSGYADGYDADSGPPDCFTIVNPSYPTVATTGGDVHAGGSIGQGVCSGAGQLTGQSFGGSVADYIASSSGLVTNFGSGGTSGSGTSLTLGNTPSLGYYSSICRPNLAAAATTYSSNHSSSVTTLNTANVSANSLNGADGTLYIDNQTTPLASGSQGVILSAGTINHRVTLYVPHDVEITGNVAMGACTSAHVCPAFGLISSGTIYIDNAVTSLAGYYSAGNNTTPGGFGDVVTCTVHDPNNIAECGNPLTVTGFLQGDNIDFYRTCIGTPSMGATCNSETVNMSSNLYISTPPAFDTTSNGEATPIYQGSLPPLY